jgi:hypothetical protein
MFDLDREIDSWCRAIRLKAGKRASSIAELKDHLYCEVERLSDEDLSAEQAFLAATERIGNLEELRLEYSKNRNLGSTLSDLLAANSQLPAGEDISKLKTWLPTITSSVGMLLGGLLAAAASSFSRSESVVMVCCMLGLLGGAFFGAMLGWRWHACWDPQMDHSE